jgi:hypothetical protein
MQRRSLLILPGAAVLGVPAFAAAIDDIAWEDRAHARSLPLRMRWPGGDAPCGLVVYSHGLGGSREGGDAWGQAWAGAGMAVLHVQHPGSDAEVLRHGMRALRAAASAEQLVATRSGRPGTPSERSRCRRWPDSASATRASGPSPLSARRPVRAC